MRVVLVEPQIPQNTGNVVRTCAATGAGLTLVEPLGFRLSNRLLKRAGLDYWAGVDVQRTADLPSLLDGPFHFFSSHAHRLYTEAPYTEESLLIFGSETSGLPQIYRDRWPDRFFRIPMLPETRCLNLSSSVAIVLYEAQRQLGFSSLE